MAETFLASMGRLIWRLAEVHQISPDAVFETAGLDPNRIDQPHARYPFQAVCDAWLYMAAASNNPHIGLEAGEHYRPSDFHAIGVTFLSSIDLIEALERLDRYETVLNSKIDFVIRQTADDITLTCYGPETTPELQQMLEDLRMSVIVALARDGVGSAISPKVIEFSYAEPRDLFRHRRTLSCPLVFSAPESRITYAKSDATRPFTAKNRDLARANDLILDDMLKRLESHDLISKVKRVVVEQLPSGTPSQEEVARLLATSSRTLQRRLAEQGTSYRNLLTAVRQELSRAYLADRAIPLTEVSYMLGFSDTSAFSRAFKRWTGQTPASFRDLGL
ncbi:MAG: AraC family transcriptional regulator [Pseudomonadales bacterium]